MEHSLWHSGVLNVQRGVPPGVESTKSGVESTKSGVESIYLKYLVDIIVYCVNMQLSFGFTELFIT